MKKSFVRTIIAGLATVVLFGGLIATANPASALTRSPSALSEVVCYRTFDVTEADWNVLSGCTLQRSDWVTISASGTIWAGVAFTGENGPQGWNNIAGNPSFPKADARAYSLLAQVDGAYRYIGTGDSFRYDGGGTPLVMRINDDVPNNGSKRQRGKAFHVIVQVHRG